MRVSLLEIETEGLRCPDAFISFKDKSKGSVINLLQMPNGTGKTTIIKLLSGALSGQISDWGPKEIKEFEGEDSKKKSGVFRITLNIESKDNKPKNITFKIRFDFIHGTADIYTIRDTGSGEELGHLPPPFLRQYISPGCVDVFCFQGDKIKDIINPNKSDAEVTINAFFGFDNINSFVNDIKNYHRNAVQSGRPISGARIDELINLITSWEERSEILYTRLEEEREKEIENTPLVEKLEKDQGDIIDAIENGTKNQKIHTDNILNTEKELSTASIDFWEELKNPFYLSDQLSQGLNEFRENLERMKLPGGSRTFFEELIEDDDGCICDEPLTPDRISNIRRNIEDYLSGDEATTLNVIKDEIKEAYANKSQALVLDKEYIKLADAIEEKTKAEVKYDEFLDSIKKNSTPENKEIFKDYKKVIIEAERIEKAIKRLTKDYKPEEHELSIPADCYSHNTAEKAIEILTIRKGKMTNRQDISKSYELLKKIINRAKNNALLEMKSHLKDLTNAKIVQTLPKGSRVEVMELDKYLKLGWNGREHSEASGAQNIIIAYSFARSVLEEAHIEFPLIVDHPVANVDIKNRATLGSTLSSMMHQFIGFLIDSEKVGFMKGVEKTGSVNYISLFSNIEGNKSIINEIEKLSKEDYEKSLNGYLTYNKDFFMSNAMGKE